jgi:UDP-GlcNAc:undecaprenyl-phosphate GlcNAc-1-phosphate transferase
MDPQLIIKTFLLPFAVASSIAYIASPIVIAIYRHFDFIDDPKHQSHPKVVHTTPVPRGGGIVIFAALLAGSLIFLGLDKHSLGLLLGALVLTVAGVFDDIKNISPYLRLALGLLSAVIVVASGIGIAYITNPFGSGVVYLNQPQIPIIIFDQLHTIWVLADIFAILWIIWCMNMINWSKGLDGQLPGQVVIASVIIAMLSLRSAHDVTQWNVVILAAITAGSFFGFLPWNLFQQKMMPGYGAGSLAGYLLAIMSILSGAKVATLIIVLIVPMMDAVYVILGRLSRGQSPVWGDRSHLHHRLLDLGWSKPKIAYTYWSITLLMGIFALQLNSKQKAFTILLIGLVFGAVLLWFNNFISSSKQSDPANGSKT